MDFKFKLFWQRQVHLGTEWAAKVQHNIEKNVQWEKAMYLYFSVKIRILFDGYADYVFPSIIHSHKALTLKFPMI